MFEEFDLNRGGSSPTVGGFEKLNKDLGGCLGALECVSVSMKASRREVLIFPSSN